jgi:hypothetical protein
VGLFAYGKIGRAISLSPDRWGVVGGDMEAPRLLDSLARRNPNDRFVIVSTCREDPQVCGFPPNVINSWTPERLEYYRAAVAPYQEIMRRVTKTDPRMLDAIRSIEGVIDAMLLPLVEKIDGFVVWAGQHGTANRVLPAVTDRSGVPGFTRPYDSFVFYAGGIFRLINAWRDLNPWANEEVWLIADPRNYLKARDIKWPLKHPVLGQFNFERDLHHERFGDDSKPETWKSTWKSDHTWVSPTRYVYSNLEVCGILPEHIELRAIEGFTYRDPFGLFINEAGFHVGQGKAQEASGRLARAPILKNWVLPLEPAFIHGKWTSASQQRLGITIEPARFSDYFKLLSSVRCTFTTPSSGSGWATTKPWEAFAVGTACFRHPAYDTQDHIYGRLPTWCRDWLSPATPEDLKARVHALNNDAGTWHAIIAEQRALYDEVVESKPWITAIEERLCLSPS